MISSNKTGKIIGASSVEIQILQPENRSSPVRFGLNISSELNKKRWWIIDLKKWKHNVRTTNNNEIIVSTKQWANMHFSFQGLCIAIRAFKSGKFDVEMLF